MSEPVRETLREIEAAKLIAVQVRAAAGGDPEFVADAIEGETGLLEAVETLTASILEDEALVAGLDDYAKRIGARKARIEARAEMKRAILTNALDVAERKKLETSVATISLKPVPPKVEVVEEPDIPAEFWKSQPPKLDRKALLAALKDKRPIPGARLSNGGATVSIRS